MTRDDTAKSLADQAAAWVPPWARRPDTDPADAAMPLAALAGPAGGVAPAERQTMADPAEAAVPAEPAEPAIPPAPAEPAVPPAPAEPPIPSEPAEPAVPPAPAEPPIPSEPAVPPVPAEPAEPDLVRVPAEQVRGALEAIMLVVDEPVSEVVLAQALELPTEQVSALLHQLSAEYDDAGRGFELRRVAGGWRLYTRADYARYVEKFVLDGQQARLTQAALETLAVVAYKQPVTRGRISAIRGVNCDGVVRTLVSRGLIEECGSEPDSGALLYRTTTLFLEKLGLDSVDQLPPLAPFLPDDVDAIADGHG